jgi:hypothetical protein
MCGHWTGMKLISLIVRGCTGEFPARKKNSFWFHVDTQPKLCVPATLIGLFPKAAMESLNFNIFLLKIRENMTF